MRSDARQNRRAPRRAGTGESGRELGYFLGAVTRQIGRAPGYCLRSGIRESGRALDIASVLCVGIWGDQSTADSENSKMH